MAAALQHCRGKDEQQQQARASSNDGPHSTCFTLQQELAAELARLPRMDAAASDTLAAAVPLLEVLPQLTMGVLAAAAEEYAEEVVRFPCLCAHRCTYITRCIPHCAYLPDSQHMCYDACPAPATAAAPPPLHHL